MKIFAQCWQGKLGCGHGGLKLGSNYCHPPYYIVDGGRDYTNQVFSVSASIFSSRDRAFRNSRVPRDSHSAMARNAVSAPMMKGFRIRVSPVLLKTNAPRQGQLAVSAPFCPLVNLVSPNHSGRSLVGAVGIEFTVRSTSPVDSVGFSALVGQFQGSLRLVLDVLPRCRTPPRSGVSFAAALMDATSGARQRRIHTVPFCD